MSAGELRTLRELICRHCGVQLEPGSEALTTRRLDTLAAEQGFADRGALLHALQRCNGNGLLDRVAERVVNHETSFFRDPACFQVLRELILPELLKQRTGPALRVWSAACSSGQEAYSVALTLAEHFPFSPVQILASDFSRMALRRAQEGIFTQFEVNRGLPARLLVNHFRQIDDRWQARRELRDRIEFRQINLVEPWPLDGRFDLVLLRNVLIYFRPETRVALLDRITRLLKPDGYLILGTGETTIGLHRGFQALRRAGTVVFQKR